MKGGIAILTIGTGGETGCEAYGSRGRPPTPNRLGDFCEGVVFATAV